MNTQPLLCVSEWVRVKSSSHWWAQSEMLYDRHTPGKDMHPLGAWERGVKKERVKRDARGSSESEVKETSETWRSAMSRMLWDILEDAERRSLFQGHCLNGEQLKTFNKSTDRDGWRHMLYNIHKTLARTQNTRSISQRKPVSV